VAKKISATISDNIDAGKDAADWKIRGALSSPHEEVVEHALRCRQLMGTAWDALDELDKIHDRCSKAEAEAKRNGEDPRQEPLDIEERCRDCGNAHELDDEAQPGEDGEDYHCTEIANDVHGDTPAAEQECGCFRPRGSADDGDGDPPEDDAEEVAE
jgi:hypothetical protein